MYRIKHCTTYPSLPLSLTFGRFGFCLLLILAVDEVEQLVEGAVVRQLSVVGRLLLLLVVVMVVVVDVFTFQVRGRLILGLLGDGKNNRGGCVLKELYVILSSSHLNRLLSYVNIALIKLPKINY